MLAAAILIAGAGYAASSVVISPSEVTIQVPEDLATRPDQGTTGFQVWNDGSGEMTFSNLWEAEWLGVDPITGTSQDENDKQNVIVTLYGLTNFDVGTYQTNIYVNSSADTLPTQQIFSLTLKVGDGVTPTIDDYDEPAICIDPKGRALIAYTEELTGCGCDGYRGLYVKRWTGEDPVAIYSNWYKVTNDWEELAYSATSNGILSAQATPRDPSIAAADLERVYVAWIQEKGTTAVTQVHFKYFNGMTWQGLNGSDVGEGISTNKFYSAKKVSVDVDSSGYPVVCWQQVHGAADYRVYVARWNGSAWVGYGNSHKTGIPQTAGQFMSNPDMCMYQDQPVVVCEDIVARRIRVFRWTGSSWSDIGTLGSEVYARNPRVDVYDENGDVYVTWIEAPSYTYPDEMLQQVYAMRYNGSWSAIGHSTTYGAISTPTNSYELPLYSDIAVGDENMVYVTWQGGTNVANSIFVKQWSPGHSSWQSTQGAGTTPGIVDSGMIDRKPAIAAQGHLPITVFLQTEEPEEGDEVVNTVVYKVAGDTEAPVFAGIQEATNWAGSVKLNWNPAVDNSSPVTYEIYQGSPRACGEIIICNKDNVFTNMIGTTTAVEYYVSSGLMSNYTYCFGVRAVDPRGYRDDNIVMLNAGPYPCNPDGNNNGVPDAWEDVHGLEYPADWPDADGDGVNNSNEWVYGINPWSSDSDLDGLTDSNEIYVVFSLPNLADSDFDGMDDGAEVDYGWDPLDADSRGAGSELGISDGDTWQLGYDPGAAVAGVYSVLLRENFEDGDPVTNGWSAGSLSQYTPNLWHLSSADPTPWMSTSHIQYLNMRSTSHSYRVANDLSPNKDDLDANYNPGAGGFVSCYLMTPAMDATNAATLSVEWNEYYETESGWDYVQVQAKTGGGANWQAVSPQRSGDSLVTNDMSGLLTTGWVHRIANLDDFAGDGEVYVRFLFQTQNLIDYDHRGWMIDDVVIRGAGGAIEGWVRDINGAVIQGARVYAIGQGDVTNRVDGNTRIAPGKILASATTSNNGAYRISGLPLGRYYVKAEKASYRSEFYNGTLIGTNDYNFGSGVNPGVYTFAEVGSGGWLDFTTNNSITNCDFELELGGTPAFLGMGIEDSSSSYQVFVDQEIARQWDGTNTAAATSINYMATATWPTNWNLPDWIDNPVQPSLYSSAEAGEHAVILSGISEYYSAPVLKLRGAEELSWRVYTNYGRAQIAVEASDMGSYPVYLDGRDTGLSTPAKLDVRAGVHMVHIRDVSSITEVIPQEVSLAMGTRTGVLFQVSGLSEGALRVHTRDAFGSTITGATVYVDSELVTDSSTPQLVNNLEVGDHMVSVSLAGYRRPAQLAAEVTPGITVDLYFTLHPDDSDFDWLADSTEIGVFTNVFTYDREDDPDADGADNLVEFDTFRLYGIYCDPGLADTDMDGASDGQEIGFDSLTNWLAYTKLYDSVEVGSQTVSVYFVGHYLDGEDNFDAFNFAASVEGDYFTARGFIYWPLNLPTVDPATFDYNGITGLQDYERVNDSHNEGSEVFGDTMPNRLDTDNDGMWDGFEIQYLDTTNYYIHPLEASNPYADPDYDGLANLDEFLGPDGIANTNDWTNPFNGDTDGDGMPDGWEYHHELDPTDPLDANLDPDGDGLINLGEYDNNTNPHNADTDLDGLSDGHEVIIYSVGENNKCDPLDYDTDNDGLLDGQEVWDKDLDGIWDGGFFPMWNGGDLDNDTYVDGPTDWDTDGDGMPDGFEVLDAFGAVRSVGLDPYNPYDATEDADGDGLSNLEEYLVLGALYGHPPYEFYPALYAGVVWDFYTDPFNSDSDGDGMPDGWEVNYGLHPMDPIPVVVGTDTYLRVDALSNFGDPDFDGLRNLREFNIRFALDPSSPTIAVYGVSTEPMNPDTDGDGLYDGEEDRAFVVNPTAQDTDGDRLFDGQSTRNVTVVWTNEGEVFTNIIVYVATNGYGEVETGVRSTRHYYKFVICTNLMTWPEVRDAAQVVTNFEGAQHDLIGHLASVKKVQENLLHMIVTQDVFTVTTNLLSIPTANVTNIAIGGILADPDSSDYTTYTLYTDENGAEESWSNNVHWSWIDGEYFSMNDQYKFFENVFDAYDFFTNTTAEEQRQMPFMDPDSPYVNYLVMSNNTRFTPLSETGLVDSYVIEWSATIPAATNHYDRALNDMWKLTWPKVYSRSLPEWKKVGDMTTIPPRWGAAMRYNAVFEAKDERDKKEDNTILMDNRRLIIMGGRDGNHRYGDVWEYSIKDEAWESGVPIGEGFSEFSAVPLYIDKNTKDSDCPCGGAYDCDATDAVGLPKNRPYTFEGESSFDWTFVTAAWNQSREYVMLRHFYKSRDDQTPVTETLGADVIGTEYREGGVLQFGDISGNAVVGQGSYSGGGSNLSYDFPGYAAIHFSDFFFDLQCEDIEKVELEVKFSQLAETAFNVDVVAEISKSMGYSPEEYSTEGGTALGSVPSSRLNTNNWVVWISSPVTLEVPVADSNRTRTIDVTDQIKYVLSKTNPSDEDNKPYWNTDEDGCKIGLVLDAHTVVDQTASILEGSPKLKITYKPKYKVEPYWEGADNGHYWHYTDGYTFNGVKPEVERKSAGLVYAYGDTKNGEGTLVLFGGINGNDVLGDTWEGEVGWDNRSPSRLDWYQQEFTNSPAARWGHCMVYDASSDRALVFGGYDSNHIPLNDLWAYYPNRVEYSYETNDLGEVTGTNTTDIGGYWEELRNETYLPVPQPRAGACMIWHGGYEYDRGLPEYCAGGKGVAVLFGGTDGKHYFNDTWIYQSGRWIMVQPNGPLSRGPSPRAFASMVWGQNAGKPYDKDDFPPCSGGAAFLFGGRTGTLPSGEDTDGDLVNDGEEYELGGTAAGRDPRINALIYNRWEENPYTNETIPFAYNRIGSVIVKNPLIVDPRSAIANMESLDHAFYNYAWDYGFPKEWRKPDYGSYEIFHDITNQMGVEAYLPEQSKLWWHEYPLGNPYDEKDAWELGIPRVADQGAKGSPPYAHSGRWCWGTGLTNHYPNSAVMELYSPVISLNTNGDYTASTYSNSFYLMFYEWLDLADANDQVRVDAIRPVTPVDISQRNEGTEKPVVTLLNDRNNAHNTTGVWRRVIVPLEGLGNEENVFIRFTLQSDDHDAAGGWYIDDVAVMQGSSIVGVLTNGAGAAAYLYGVTYTGYQLGKSVLGQNGAYRFDLLAAGNYSLRTPGGIINIIGLNGSLDVGSGGVEPVESELALFGDLRIVYWDAVPGVEYIVDVFIMDTMTWVPLATVTPNSVVGTYTDHVSDGVRWYRVRPAQ